MYPLTGRLHRPPRLRVAGWLALVVVVVAGCGVPAEDSPREVRNGNVPIPGLRDSAPTAAGVGVAALPLYFVRDDKLVRVTRRVQVWATVETQVRHLFAGPDETERLTGLTSALNGTTAITGIRLSGGQATVEIAGKTDEPGRSDEILAFGQVVCTLTTRSGVTGVTFERDGQRLDVPRADGSLSQAPLTSADYADLIAG